MTATVLVPTPSPQRADTARPALPPSRYAEWMPALHAFATLPAGDPRRQALRAELILAFLPVADHLALRYSRNTSASFDDLKQAGTVALITAIDRWDPDLARGEFLGYLIPCVRGELLRWFRDRTWSMRVPRRLKDDSVAITRITGLLSQELGRAPRPSELAARLGLTVEAVIDALGAKAQQQSRSLDVPDLETGAPLADRLGAPDPELGQIDHRMALRPLLDKLPERERTIVVLRFFGEQTQTQIAQQVGLSQMHVSRLLTRTLASLRRDLLDEDGDPEPIDDAGDGTAGRP